MVHKFVAVIELKAAFKKERKLTSGHNTARNTIGN